MAAAVARREARSRRVRIADSEELARPAAAGEDTGSDRPLTGEADHRAALALGFATFAPPSRDCHGMSATARNPMVDMCFAFGLAHNIASNVPIRMSR